MRKMNIIKTGALLAAMAAVMMSCVSVQPKESWENTKSLAAVEKAVAKADKIAVVGYNSVIGLNDTQMDGFIKESPFAMPTLSVDLSLESPLEKFPVAQGTVDKHAAQLESLKESSDLEVVPAPAMFAVPNYYKQYESMMLGSTDKSLTKEQLRAQMYRAQEVIVAKDYNHTYDWSERQIMDYLKAPIRETLKELDADLGVIVVEVPFIQTKTWSLVPDKLINKQENFSVTAVRTYYYFINDKMGNNHVGTKIIYNEGVRKLQEGYTDEQRELDSAEYLAEADNLAEKNNEEFFAWLNSLK